MNKDNEIQAVRINSLLTPLELIKQYPASENILKNIMESCQRIKEIIRGKDQRLLVIIGPCSIHDCNAAIDYAQRLKELRDKYFKYLEIIMRTYFEKPRTIIGWEGLIFDPDLNGSYRVNYGLKLARKLLLQVNELGIPTATEFLNISTRQFIADLISWAAIGARTTESQIHREMASSLSCPVGFKNGTNGNVSIAIDAIRSSRSSHVFLSPDEDGQMTIYRTSGNPFSHIIMRGGNKPNYHAADIAITCRMLRKFSLPEQLIIDFSHSNCQKQYRRQMDVCDDVCRQISHGSNVIVGVMVESFINGGAQNIITGYPVVYGQSITDPCLSWEESEVLLEKLATAVNNRFNSLNN